MAYFASKKFQQGYSLIELAIVIIIVSVLMAGGVGYYQVWVEKQMHIRTVNNLEDMALNVSAYRGQLGSYPCPAPLDVDRNDPNYGRITCGSGVISVPSHPSIGKTVLIGMIPFRDLNISEEFAYDAHGQRLLYAVTKEQAQLGIPYKPGEGGISINDEFGNSRIEPPHTADFIILSHGKDRVGSYNNNGILFTSCTNASDLDKENCNQDSTFVVAMYSNSAAQAHHSDDMGLYQMPLNVPLWARNPNNPKDIYSIRQLGQDGNAGGDWRFNFYAENNPSLVEDARLWVGGNVRVDGQVQANKFCFYDNKHCFKTKMIAGDMNSADPEQGLDCADTLDGGFMWGIYNGEIHCKGNVFDVKCPDKEYLVGLTNGEPHCVRLPCKAETITSECAGDTYDLRDPNDPTALFIADGTQTEIFYGGDSGCYQTQYQCDAGRWVKILDDGYEFCSCTTLATHVDNYLSCPPPNASMQYGMAWDRTVQCDSVARVCNKGNWVDSYKYCPPGAPGPFTPITPPGDPECPPSGCLTGSITPPGGGGGSSRTPQSGGSLVPTSGNGPSIIPCTGTDMYGRPCGG